MNINLHARKIDIKVRAAIMAMGEFAMSRLVPSTRLRNNITLNIHLKHHVEDGEAMLSEFTNPNKPREFKVIIDHHRIETDDFGRTLTDTEWAHSILRILAHELVHVKQFARGELSDNLQYWKGKDHSSTKYWEQPWEKEARKLQKKLMVQYITEFEVG